MKLHDWLLRFGLLFGLMAGMGPYLSKECQANNLRFEGKVVLSDTTDTDVLLSVTVEWDNSWFGSYNNDAVWLFFKYRMVEDLKWRHLTPAKGSISEDYFLLLPGISSGQTVGAMVYRKAISSGNNRVAYSFRWSYPAGVTRQAIASREVALMAQGVEMVFQPWGPFMAGDGMSDGSIVGDGGPQKVESENEQTLKTPAVTIPVAFPKGFQGFYTMKYEVTQEQYTVFLNTLDREAQLALLGSGLASLKAEAFLFGGGGSASHRNGIVVGQPLTADRPAVFRCALSAEADGGQLACNYLSVADMLAYCSWAGLRPMSELEFEKTGRQMSESTDVTAGEYAWGTTTANPMTGLKAGSEGRGDEVPQGGNVNGGGGFDGPVRAGAFAALAGERQTAGAGYGGVMEMSGNLAELCVGVERGASFNGLVHGDGTGNALWSALPAAAFGRRGGAFGSGMERLRLSDRAEMSAVSDLAERDPQVGFRGVRGLSVEDFVFDPGEIKPLLITEKKKNRSAAQNSLELCVGEPFNIVGGTFPEIVGIAGVTFSFKWYCNDTLIAGATGENLEMPLGVVGAPEGVAVYLYKRRATSYLGSADSEPVTITVYDKPSIAPLTLPAHLCAGTELKEGVNIQVPAIDNHGKALTGQGWLLGEVPIMVGGIGYTVTYETRLREIRYWAENECSERETSE